MDMLISLFVFGGVVLGVQTVMSPAYRLGTGRRKTARAPKARGGRRAKAGGRRRAGGRRGRRR